MNIEAGDYVRTNDGYIRKVIQVNSKGSYNYLCYGAYSVDTNYKYSAGISDKKIKSHSKNIIDLIEVRRLCEWTKNNSNNQRPIYKRPDRFMD